MLTMGEYYHVPRIVAHRFWRLMLNLFFRLFYFLRVEGRDHIPSRGPLLFASNHPSYLDPILVGLGVPHPVSFMSWGALFRGPRWFARMIQRFGAFPIDLDKEVDAASYRVALDVLREGHRLVIFPEGGREEGEGQISPMRAGAARLALKAGVTIVPVRIEGAWRAWPKPKKMPRLFKPIKVTFGPPIAIPEARLSPAEREERTREIMDRLGAFYEKKARVPALDGQSREPHVQKMSYTKENPCS